jgi:hypothetical protein
MYGYGYRYNSGLVVGAGGGGAPFSNTYSLDFDGVDDYVSMGNVLNLANDGSDAISISLWLKTTLSSLGYLVSKQTAFTDGYGVFMLPTGEIAFYLGSSTSSARIYAYTQNTFNDGDWHNVVTTYDGSQDVSGLNIYVNNTSQALTVVTNNTPNNVSNIANFAIGMRNGDAYPYLDYIDEVSVFNSELSASDVTNIYNGGTPTDLTDLSPIAWYRFEEGSGTTAIDSGSGGNNGTLNNGVENIRSNRHNRFRVNRLFTNRGNITRHY